MDIGLRSLLDHLKRYSHNVGNLNIIEYGKIVMCFLAHNEDDNVEGVYLQSMDTLGDPSFCLLYRGYPLLEYRLFRLSFVLC